MSLLYLPKHALDVGSLMISPHLIKERTGYISVRILDEVDHAVEERVPLSMWRTSVVGSAVT